MTSHLIIKICCIFLFIIIFPFSCMAGCPCDNLKEVTSQDDLLKQIYETALNSNCLDSISSTKLQEIWRIPVIESSNMKEFRAKIKQNEYSINETLRSRIGVYVDIIKTKIWDPIYIIRPTDEYMKKYKTLFPDELPQSLPKVTKQKDPTPSYRYGWTNTKMLPPPYRRDHDDFFEPGYFYYWAGVHGGKRHMFFVVTQGVIERVKISDADIVGTTVK